jgi:hypothetical protein
MQEAVIFSGTQNNSISDQYTTLSQEEKKYNTVGRELLWNGAREKK